MRPPSLLSSDARRRVEVESGGDARIVRELELALCRTNEPGAELTHRFLPLTRTLVDELGRGLRELDHCAQLTLAVAAEHLQDDIATVLDAAGLILGHPLGCEVLEAPADAGVIELEAGHFRFTDPLMRSVAARYGGRRTRREVHDALSAVVPNAGDVAWHRAHVVDAPDESVAAALESSARQAHPRDDAVDALRRQVLAARLSPLSAQRARRWADAATLCFEVGRLDIGDDLLRRAEAVCDDLPGVEGEVTEMPRLRFGRTEVWSAARHRAACRRRAAGLGDGTHAADAVVDLAQRWAHCSTPADLRQVAALPASLAAADVGGPEQIATLAWIDPPDARRRLPAAIENACPQRSAWPLGWAAWRVGMVEESAELLSTAVSCFRESGRRARLAHAQALRAQLAVSLGDWADAAVAADEAIALAGFAECAVVARAHGVRALLRTYRGDHAEAGEDRRAMAHILTRETIDDLVALLELARGVELMQNAAWDGAVAAFREVISLVGVGGGVELAAVALTHLAEVAVRSRCGDEVCAATTELSARGPIPPALGPAFAYAQALVVECTGEGGAVLSAALVSIPSRWSFLRGRAEFALGGWWRRHHRPTDGRRVLGRAGDTFDRIGAWWWSEAVQRELRVGAPASPGAPRRTVVLSGQELQIAGLVAEGLSNREIGERLFLSPRTVGSHLYRMFPKLGVTSRVQLAALVHAMADADFSGTPDRAQPLGGRSAV